MDNSNTYPPTREDFSDWIDDAEQAPATQPPFTREGCAVGDSARPDPDPAPAAVDVMPWEEEEDGDAPHIPWTCRGKVDHFPAFVARGGIFKAGRPAAGLGSVEAKIQGLGGAMCLGQQLGMRDKPVWEIAVQVAKENSANMCAYAPVSLREFAARLGWTDRSGKALAWIWACIERLSQARGPRTAREPGREASHRASSEEPSEAAFLGGRLERVLPVCYGGFPSSLALTKGKSHETDPSSRSKLSFR